MHLSDADIQSLFADFADARGLALAVSGGADSMALALAAARLRDAPPIRVMIVDHRLRSESALEARRVADWTEALGLSTSILVRAGPPPSGDVQNAARAARYALLAEAAHAQGCDHILTAHHRDDQAETVLLRLARGSGLKGLCAMSRRAPLGPGLTLARPFLDLPKSRLVATCVAAGQPWIDDPSNSDERFARARLRRLMPMLATEGLDSERLAATAARLARAQAAIDSAADALLAAAFRLDEAGFGEWTLAPLAAAPEEVGLRALARTLASVGGGIYSPRLTRLERSFQALAELHASTTRAVVHTLAGCRIGAQDGRALIVREIARIERPTILLNPGESIIWDGRWRIALAATAAAPLAAQPLGPSGWGAIRERATRIPPAAARPALLCLRRDDIIVAVPHVGLTSPDLAVSPLPQTILPAACLSAATIGRTEASLGKGKP